VIDIYGGKDPRVLPRYSPAEVAHYLRLSLATLKKWVYGRVDPNGHEAEPVIKLPGPPQRHQHHSPWLRSSFGTGRLD